MPNSKGGLEFRDLEDLTLQVRLENYLKNPVSMLSRVMQAKLFLWMIFHRLLLATDLNMSGGAFLLPGHIFYKGLDRGR